MRQHLSDHLDELERTLKALGWWQNDKPSDDALASQAPFCADTLLFSEWLQWVYLIKMRHLLIHNMALPVRSGLLPIAEEAWRGCSEDIQPILRVIAHLDDLINHAEEY